VADIGPDQALGLRDALSRDGIVCGQGGGAPIGIDIY
jgi:hypothetical protein